MSNSPFFSIITPTYNRESFLEEMISSVATQTCQDYEHIIIDDGSTDGTEALINRLVGTNPKIVYIKQENKGRSAARNVGIEQAKGEYICFLDSDDVWSENYLKDLYINASNANFLATKMVWVNSGTMEKNPRPIEGFTYKEPQRIIELQIGMNVCVKRGLFTGNLFNTDLSINEDFELWTRIICAKNINVIPVPKSLYLVTTPEVVGETTIDLLNKTTQAQQIMKANTVMAERVPSSFWKQRFKGVLLRKIRIFEKHGERWNLVFSIMKYIVLYPNEQANKSLLVSLLYNLPGGGLLKKLVASIKGKR